MSAYKPLTVRLNGETFELHRDAKVYRRTPRGVRKVDADTARTVRAHWVARVTGFGGGE